MARQGNTPPSPSKVTKSSPKEKKITNCSYCEAQFGSPGDLTRHLQVHHNVVQFLCEYRTCKETNGPHVCQGLLKIPEKIHKRADHADCKFKREESHTCCFDDKQKEQHWKEQPKNNSEMERAFHYLKRWRDLKDAHPGVLGDPKRYGVKWHTGVMDAAREEYESDRARWGNVFPYMNPVLQQANPSSSPTSSQSSGHMPGGSNSQPSSFPSGEHLGVQHRQAVPAPSRGMQQRMRPSSLPSPATLQYQQAQNQAQMAPGLPYRPYNGESGWHQGQHVSGMGVLHPAGSPSFGFTQPATQPFPPSSGNAPYFLRPAGYVAAAPGQMYEPSPVESNSAPDFQMGGMYDNVPAETAPQFDAANPPPNRLLPPRFAPLDPQLDLNAGAAAGDSNLLPDLEGGDFALDFSAEWESLRRAGDLSEFDHLFAQQELEPAAQMPPRRFQVDPRNDAQFRYDQAAHMPIDPALPSGGFPPFNATMDPANR